jgi:hypothetical protein
MSKSTEGFVALAMYLVAWPFMMMWRAYAIIVLWGWFVTPYFSVQPLSIYATAGLLLVLHLILPMTRAPKTDDGPIETLMAGAFAYGFLAPAMAVGLGWIWKTLQWGLA